MLTVVCGEDVVVVLESDGGVGRLFPAEEGRLGQSALRRRGSHLGGRRGRSMIVVWCGACTGARRGDGAVGGKVGRCKDAVALGELGAVAGQSPEGGLGGNGSGPGAGDV